MEFETGVVPPAVGRVDHARSLQRRGTTWPLGKWGDRKEG